MLYIILTLSAIFFFICAGIYYLMLIIVEHGNLGYLIRKQQSKNRLICSRAPKSLDELKR